MFFTLLVLLLFSSSSMLFLQQQQSISPDSLSLLIKKANAFRTNNPDSTIKLLHFLRSAVEESKETQLIGDHLFELSSAHYVKGNYDSALVYITLADNIYSQNELPSGEIKTGNMYGLIHQVRENHKLAKLFFKKAFSIAELTQDSIYLAAIPYNLAISYSNLLQYDSATYYYRVSLKKAEQFKIALQRRRSRMRLAEVHNNMGQPDSALLYIKPLQTELQSFTNWDKGYFLGIIAETVMQLGEYKQATSFALEGLDIQKKLDAKWEQLRLHNILSKTYATLNDYQSAYEHFSRYAHLKDSLLGVKKQNQLIELELENQLLENERLAISSLEKEKELENNRLWVIILLLIVATISFTLLIVLWYHKKNIELKNSLKETNDQLKLANDFKSELISIIGHDMYNMITPLSGFFNLINNNHMSVDEFLSVAPMLEDNTEYLQLMFSNLQKWAESQHDATMTNPQVVSIHELSKEFALLFGSRLNITNLTLTTNITISRILFDENHLKHILHNLIHNAIKYTPNGGTITLFCTHDISSNQTICGVTDTGKGLSSEMIHKILEGQTRFTNPGIRSEKGTGLGLMTIKRFLMLNNSQLQIKSEEGKGSTFYFEVKAADEHH